MVDSRYKQAVLFWGEGDGVHEVLRLRYLIRAGFVAAVRPVVSAVDDVHVRVSCGGLQGESWYIFQSIVI